MAGTYFSDVSGDRQISLGQSSQVTGRLVYSGAWNAGQPPPAVVDRRVIVYQEPTGDHSEADWTAVTSAVTDADGRFSFAIAPEANTNYSIRLPAVPQLLGNAYQIFEEEVAPVTDLTAPEATLVDARTVGRNGLIYFSTSGSRRGARGVVWLQRWNGHGWRTVAARRLTSSAGRPGRRLKIPFRDHTPGLHTYRLVKPGDRHHANGISRTLHVRIR